MQWFTSAVNPWQNLSALQQSNMLLYNVTYQAAALVKGATITRLIVDLQMRNTFLSQTAWMFWGITTVNADARAALAFPDPSDLGETAGWMVRGRLVATSLNLVGNQEITRTMLDIRSQRVFRNEKDELHLIVDNGPSAGCEWTAFIRVLVKLP